MQIIYAFKKKINRHILGFLTQTSYKHKLSILSFIYYNIIRHCGSNFENFEFDFGENKQKTNGDGSFHRIPMQGILCTLHMHSCNRRSCNSQSTNDCIEMY